MGNNYVLAMYDIRGKQEFIYKCNHLKEIMGASWIIRDLYKDYLYPLFEDGKGIFHDQEVDFTPESFEQHLKDGYIGEVVYEGGGNFILLFKDVETFKDVTYAFTKKVMEAIGTLRVLGTYIEGVNFDNYDGDCEELYKKHHNNEKQESNTSPWGALPIVEVDRNTFLPMEYKMKFGKNEYRKLSKDSYAKYRKFVEVKKKDKAYEGDADEKILDKLVFEKGEDSLLAIVYIDGNNMGAKVQKCCDDKNSYAECVKALRDFSKVIQTEYVDNGKKRIDEYLEKEYKGTDRESIKKKRLVIGAGDEINFICNAHDAFGCAKAYLEGLGVDENGTRHSACAGIAIFHSHDPYAEVYRIAEECCESGKAYMKANKIEDKCFIDYHFCQGAIGTSLEEIRKIEGNLNETDKEGKTVVAKVSRPWMLGEKPESAVDIADTNQVEEMIKVLDCFGRSNVKSLIVPSRESEYKFDLEVARIKAHMSQSKYDDLMSTSFKDMDPTLKRNLIYDMAVVYDIWFKAKEEKDEKSNN